MTDPLTRIPKIGDRVVALGQKDIFEVIAVHTEQMTVNLKLIGDAEYYDTGIPWEVLGFSDGEESYQVGSCFFASSLV